MRNVMIFVFGVMLLFTPASAAGLKLTLTNMSGDQIVEITVRPITVESEAEAGAGAGNLIPAPIDVAAKTDVTIEAQDGVCVFDLQFTFASGQIQSRPDTDLCQTDQIIVE